MSLPPIDPVCAIHGKKASEHEGGRCLYCCICFKPLEPDECAEDASGQKWDVCQGQCAIEAGVHKRQTKLTGKEANAETNPSEAQKGGR